MQSPRRFRGARSEAVVDAQFLLDFRRASRTKDEHEDELLSCKGMKLRVEIWAKNQGGLISVMKVSALDAAAQEHQLSGLGKGHAPATMETRERQLQPYNFPCLTTF